MDSANNYKAVDIFKTSYYAKWKSTLISEMSQDQGHISTQKQKKKTRNVLEII